MPVARSRPTRVAGASPNLREEEVESIREAKFWLELRIQLAEEHPNPKRIGCPCVSALQRGASARNLDPRISQHLFRCSPCYRAYSRFLREWIEEFRRRHTPARGLDEKGQKPESLSLRASGSRS